ncbi:MAG TPA: efflux RND transporter periplasmic adaptor subunit [Luteibaculaceae bacterium]|nr:efflux RND transporter periplasmic adaptor subunit [Luteibaculaceae bacterium]
MRYAILAAATAVLAGSCAEPEGSNAGKKADQKPMTTQAVVVEPSNLNASFETSGSLRADEQVEITSEIAGRLTSIYFTEGGAVRRGQILATLFNDDIKAQLRKLESQRKLLSITLDRQRPLVESKGISQQDYDLTASQLEGVMADIAILEAQLAKTIIRAPFDGVVGLRNASIGAVVNSGQVLTSVQNKSQLKLDFALPEKYANALDLGSKIQFTIEGKRDTFEARVAALNSTVDEASRTRAVRARFNNTAQLVPGTFAKVWFSRLEGAENLSIPAQSVIPDARSKKVYVVRNGLATLQTVELGDRVNDEVIVLSGLQAGDTVLTTGLMQLKPGNPVKPEVSKRN